ncbi:MAG: nickel-dependent lactate racemase [Candidatus Bipolaricaulota bacterium]|nr:nickel-dependent lactate racemase [Candidatus Bipolaricaulota bacterium]
MMRLPYGVTEIDLEIPEKNLLGVVEGKKAPVIGLAEAFKRAWESPIGIDAPETSFHPGEKVIFAVTDHTRPTPTREILPLIWERISSRVRRDDVTIVIAKGTHRSPTEEELEAMLGDLRREFRVVIHDCDRNNVEIGRSARGTPILIDRIVAEADRVVTLGHIGMHYYAGYSGGRKNILPGVAGRETIEVNHAQLTDPHCEGCVYRENPISREMSEAAKLVGVDFIVDCVFDAHGRVAKIVVGDLEKAHAVGRAFWDSLFQVEVQERADLVIVSAGGHPKDIDLYQAYKALYNAGRAVKEGGMILLVAACSDGIGNDLFEDWVMRCTKPEDVFGILEEEGFKLGGHKAVYLAKDLARAQIALVSDMEDELVRRFFLMPLSDPNEAVALAREQFGEGFHALVMPHGTDIFPLVSD